MSRKPPSSASPVKKPSIPSVRPRVPIPAPTKPTNLAAAPLTKATVPKPSSTFERFTSTAKAGTIRKDTLGGSKLSSETKEAPVYSILTDPLYTSSVSVELPEEMVTLVMSHLPKLKVVELRRVCRHWHAAAHNPLLWQDEYGEELTHASNPLKLFRQGQLWKHALSSTSVFLGADTDRQRAEVMMSENTTEMFHLGLQTITRVAYRDYMYLGDCKIHLVENGPVDVWDYKGNFIAKLPETVGFQNSYIVDNCNGRYFIAHTGAGTVQVYKFTNRRGTVEVRHLNAGVNLALERHLSIADITWCLNDEVIGFHINPRFLPMEKRELSKMTLTDMRTGKDGITLTFLHLALVGREIVVVCPSSKEVEEEAHREAESTDGEVEVEKQSICRHEDDFCQISVLDGTGAAVRERNLNKLVISMTANKDVVVLATHSSIQVLDLESLTTVYSYEQRQKSTDMWMNNRYFGLIIHRDLMPFVDLHAVTMGKQFTCRVIPVSNESTPAKTSLASQWVRLSLSEISTYLDQERGSPVKSCIVHQKKSDRVSMAFQDMQSADHMVNDTATDLASDHLERWDLTLDALCSLPHNDPQFTAAPLKRSLSDRDIMIPYGTKSVLTDKGLPEYIQGAALLYAESLKGGVWRHRNLTSDDLKLFKYWVES